MTHPAPRQPVPPGPAARYTLHPDAATLALLERLVAEHGEIIRIESADRRDPSYVLNDPAHIRQVLVANHANYVKGVGFERVKLLLGNGIIVSDGDDWRRQRTMIQPGFSRSNIAAHAEPIRAHARELATAWDTLARGDGLLDLTTAMSGFGLQVILRAIFSHDLARLEGQPGGNPFAFLATDPTRDIRTVVRLRELSRAVQECIDRRRASGDRPFDFLSALLDARDRKTGGAMTDKELLDEVKTLIVAGHETSAGTLNWAWYLLAQHPAVADRLLAELATLGPGTNFGFEALMALRYLPAVLKETLRLYPPVWLFSRRAVAADRLGDYPIPAGAHIFISPYLVHRRPQLWPEPGRFDPDRFLGPAAEAQDPLAFIPFSAGARRCIGEYFSFVEMQMHLAVLFPRFQLTHVPVAAEPVDIDPAINLRTRHGIRMRVTPRAAASPTAVTAHP
jgi:cytochrome P450